MDSGRFGFTANNLALCGILEEFLELFTYTKTVYLQVLEEHPYYRINQEFGREYINRIAKLRICGEYNRMAGLCLHMFADDIKTAELQPQHLKYFDFFDEEKIRHISWLIEFNRELAEKGYSLVDKKYLSNDHENYVLEDTIIGFDDFLDFFRRAVMRCIYEHRYRDNSAYTIFQTRKDVDKSVDAYIKRRICECIIPLSENKAITNAPLYLYDALNSIGCKRNGHQLVAKRYYARHADGHNVVALPVHYCNNCGKYLCGRMSYSLFKVHFGRFAVDTRELISESNGGWQLLGESKLHQLGYNVAEGNLSVAERRNLLISLLESKQLSFFEIVATIEQDLRIFGTNYRMQNAVKKWRDDLLFINEYMASKKEAMF